MEQRDEESNIKNEKKDTVSSIDCYDGSKRNMLCPGYQFSVTAVPPKLNISHASVGQEFGQGSTG